MHEAGVTERIMEIVLEHAENAGGGKVTDVYLEVGDASGVDPDSVTLHWPLQSKGTIAEGATLHVNRDVDPQRFQLTSIEVDDSSG